MAHVTALAQHIFTLHPDKDAARLCFYQYLKNLCDATEQVTPELINGFYARALSFDHWRENKAQLFSETENLLTHFLKSGGHLRLPGLWQAKDIQALPVENLKNLEAVVVRHVEKNRKPDEKVRVIRDGEKRVLAVTLHADRGLTVTSFAPLLAIRDGELVPLHQQFTLKYTSDLQLSPTSIQQVEVGPHTSALFHSGVEGLRGVFVRGYTFQKFASLDGGGIHRYPLLFYPLKRIEQFFVDRRSDPVYLELTRSLEEALGLLGSGSSESEAFANAALERARLALEHIYPEDRLTRLFIDLEKRVRRTPTPEPTPQAVVPARSHQMDSDIEGVDLLALHEARLKRIAPTELDPKDEQWPAIKNLPV